MSCRAVVMSVTVLVLAVGARAERSISADAYLDKARGMWMGEILGNYAGRGLIDPSDPTSSNREGYRPRGGGTYDIGWSSFINNDMWVADDDTFIEYMYLDLLKGNPSPSPLDITGSWTSNFPTTSGLYFANKQARLLMDYGYNPPETGNIHKNMHWYAIDSQITTESIGSMSPGMRQRAADRTETFAKVTNDGYSVFAAQYYAAMYASAAFDSDVETLVQKGLALVPDGSRTRQVIDDVISCYETDKLAGNLSDPDAWRDTQIMLWDEYGEGNSGDRYYHWIESTVNCGLTTMALLYGQGDFMRTVEIGVLGGYDADCNPATAGGLVGMAKGYDSIMADLSSLSPSPGDNYAVSRLVAVGSVTTITQVAQDFQTVAEAEILSAGGWIEQTSGDRIYHLPDETAPTPPVLPPQGGPRGLVGDVLAAGGTVSVSASIAEYNAGADRTNLNAIIDGITDVRYNGHLPYWTNDGDNDQPEGGDYYEISFDIHVVFTSVIFYEGDIYSNNNNGDPRIIEPRGGYFLDNGSFIVEVGNDGVFTEAANLQFSEALDPFEYFQMIELTFDELFGDAVRIRGDAGGTREFTSIVELEAYGRIIPRGDFDHDGYVDASDIDLLLAEVNAETNAAAYDLTGDGYVDADDADEMIRVILDTEYGDANLNHKVNTGDLAITAGNWMTLTGMGWADGDFTGDGAVNTGDLAIMAENWFFDRDAGAQSLPEPATILLLGAGGIALLRSRKRSRLPR